MAIKRTNKKEWWVTLFDEKYIKTYVDMVTPEATEEQVSFLIKTLKLKKSSKILDLACGHGRIAIALAKRGYKVVGSDYSKHFISLARKAAKDEGAKVEFCKEDMRRLRDINKFDVVLNIFTSFGYFSEQDNMKVLANISRALKSKGAFVLDTNNVLRTLFFMKEGGQKDSATGGLVSVRKSKLSNGIVVTTKDTWNPLTMRWQMVRSWKEKGKLQSYHSDTRLYLLPELKHLLAEHGLMVEKVFGDFKGSAFNIDSRRLVIIAKKRKLIKQ